MDFIPNTDQDRAQMLEVIGVDSVDDLLQVVPAAVRRPALNLPAPLTEMELKTELHHLADRNADATHFAHFLGAGAYHHYVPAAVSQLLLRSEFYTAYTPYQPEVSQGVLQAMFEFQSMICSLMGMEVTNASMYDGASAMAEAALMAISATRRQKVVVAGSVHPEYRAVLNTYVASRGFEVATSEVAREGDRIVEGAMEDLLDDQTACCIVQQPNFFGGLRDIGLLARRIHELGGLLIVSADPISLGMLKSPGEWGADIAVGEGQGLGNAVSFGGPYLVLLACRERFVRQMPGRLVGATVDTRGQRGFVLTLQTREQHIRREKATSNICTSEALMALAASIYMALVGPEGLRQVASLCHDKAHYAADRISSTSGFTVLAGGPFFNEFVVEGPVSPAEINRALLDHKIIGGYDLGKDYPSLKGCMLLCTTEINTRAEIEELAAALGRLSRKGGVR